VVKEKGNRVTRSGQFLCVQPISVLDFAFYGVSRPIAATKQLSHH